MDYIFNFLNIIFIISLVIIPVIFASKGKSKETVSLIGAIALALCFTNLDKFSRFKGAGFEAELKTAVNETYAAIDQVKKLAVSISGPIASFLATSDKPFMYFHLKYKINQIDEIRKTLQELEIPEKEIDEALYIFYERVHKDHIKRVLNYTNKILTDENKNSVNIDNLNIGEWSLDKIHKLLNDNNIHPNGELKEVLSDLEYWEKNKKLRREKKWQG